MCIFRCPPACQSEVGLAMVGASGMADDLEQRMNKAAEAAAPKAAAIFGDAVGRMSIEDARGILTGPQDSATQYFKRTTAPQLKEAMKPSSKSACQCRRGAVVQRMTAKVGRCPSPRASS